MLVKSALLVVILHSEVLAETSSNTTEMAPPTFRYPVKGNCPFDARRSCPVSLLAGRGEPSPISFTVCAKSCGDVPEIDNNDVYAWTNGLWAKTLSFKDEFDRKPSEVLSDFAKLEHVIDGMQAKEEDTFDLMAKWVDDPTHIDSSLKALLKGSGHSVSPLIERATWPPYAAKPWKGKLIVIVGGGPIGLRMAVEAMLLGADVTLADGRDGWTRANVMKMWPIAKHDLESIGLKEFNLLSGESPICNIAVMQHAVLRVALVLGANVEIMKFKELKVVKGRYGAVFEKDGRLLPPIDFDAIFDASGVGGALVSAKKANGQPIFKRESDANGGSRVAITANFERFKGDKSKEWAFGQTSITAVGAKYLDDKQKLGLKPKVDLKDLVWFQSTLSNYVVMALDIEEIQAKFPKAFKNAAASRSDLLGRKNIDYDELLKLVLQVAKDWKIPFDDSEGAPKMLDGINKLAIFDFMGGAISRDPDRDKTSMIQEIGDAGQYVLAIGDSLRAPFWPEGTGMSRGILSVLHAGFVLTKAWQQNSLDKEQAEAWAHLAAYARGEECKGKCREAAVKEYVLKGYRGEAPPNSFGVWM